MCERCGCSVTSQQNAEQLQKNNNLGGKCKMAKWVYMFTEGAKIWQCQTPAQK